MLKLSPTGMQSAYYLMSAPKDRSRSHEKTYGFIWEQDMFQRHKPLFAAIQPVPELPSAAAQEWGHLVEVAAFSQPSTPFVQQVQRATNRLMQSFDPKLRQAMIRNGFKVVVARRGTDFNDTLHRLDDLALPRI